MHVDDAQLGIDLSLCKQTSWRSTQVQSVDFATMIYGLAIEIVGRGWY